MNPVALKGVTAYDRTFSRNSLMPAVVGVVIMALVTWYALLHFDVANVFVFGSILLTASAAIALNVLMGTVGQVSLGTAAFLAIGAFGSVIFGKAGVPFPVDIILDGIVVSILGLIVGLPAVRLRGLELLLATLAAVYIVQFAVEQYQTDASGSAGFLVSPISSSTNVTIWVLFGVLALFILATRALVRFRLGRAMRMVRDHDLAAATLGIRVTHTKLYTFMITAGATGIIGGLTAHFTQSVVSDTFSLLLSVQFVEMIIVGGLDLIAGAVIGAALIGALPVWIPSIVSSFTSQETASIDGPLVASAIIGLAIIVFVMFGSEGLAGLGSRLLDRLIRPLRRRAERAEVRHLEET